MFVVALTIMVCGRIVLYFISIFYRRYYQNKGYRYESVDEISTGAKIPKNFY
jgi:hypothetical protein